MGRAQTGFTETYAQSLSVDCDLSFDLETWFLIATHCLKMKITCVILFSNPTMQDEVLGRTRFWNTQITRIPRNAVSRLPALFHKIEVNL